MSIQWQEHQLDEVMRYFSKGFGSNPKGEKVIKAEWFIDQSKNTVVFKLYVDEPPDNRPG